MYLQQEKTKRKSYSKIILIVLTLAFCVVSENAFSEIYICRNEGITYKESNGEWDMGSTICDFTFSVEIQPSSAGVIGPRGPVCPSGIGCWSSTKKFFYYIIWNSDFDQGNATVIVRRQRKKGLSCGNDGGNDIIITDSYYKEPPYGNRTIGNVTLNGIVTNQISVTKQAGGTVSLLWDNGGSGLKPASFRVYFPGGAYEERLLPNRGPGDPAPAPILLPRSTEGSYQVSVLLMSPCSGGNWYTWGTVTINVLPACANDPGPGPPYTNIVDIAGVSPTPNPIVVDGGYNDNASWKEGGGYEVEQNTTTDPRNYKINFSNVTDFSSYYTITCNGSNSDIPFTRNGTTVDFRVNASIGWYEFAITPLTPGSDNYCRNYPNVNVFVGGLNQTFSEHCIIYLPEYLIYKGIIGADKVARHFRSTVKSSQGIITTSGVILMSGAELKIEEGDFDTFSDVDNKINFTYGRTFDDNGRITGESRSYFDDMGRGTQTQVKNLTSGVVLASEQLYDKFGRPAITTLPAPISTTTGILNHCGLPAEPWENLVFDFNPNFIVRQDGTAYDFTAFDNYVGNNTRESDPLPVGNGSAGNLGWYYSANNNAASSSPLKEPYVPVTNFPYTRVLYENDGTNLVRGSASAGDQHKAGAGHVPVVQKVALTSSDDLWIGRYLSMRGTEYIGYNTSLTEFKDNLYKMISTDTEGNQSVTYVTKEGQTIIAFRVANPDEVTFVFFDDVGRGRFTISPNGVMQYFGLGQYTTPVVFADIDKTEYIYNHRGWLLEKKEKDFGTTKYLYRRDGNVRFSQNTEQALLSRFTYIYYDKAGRPVESGEFAAASGSGLDLNFSTVNTSFTGVLEYSSPNSDLSDISKGAKLNWKKITYDIADQNGIADAEFLAGRVSRTESKNGSKTWFSYDERGRIVKTKNNIPGLGEKKMEYKYNPQGNIMEVAYQRGSDDGYYHYYEYTSGSVLSKIYSGTNEPIYSDGVIQNKASLIEQAEYFYYKHGPLKRIKLREGLQGIDYVYTIQGWLKSINHHDTAKDPGGDGNDLFGMSLEYFNGDYQKNNISNISGLTNPQHFNGSIRAMSWHSQKTASSSVPNTPTSYVYNYDQKHQLTDASWATVNLTTNSITYAGNAYKEGGMTYDANGNIRSLGRYDNNADLQDDFLPVGQTDKFVYLVNSNKLSEVAGYSSYTYNSIGQVTEVQSQVNTKNMQMTYDLAGITEEVIITGDPLISKVRFIYNEMGKRIKKEVFDASNLLVEELWYVHDHTGNLVSTYTKDMSASINQEEISILGGTRIGKAYRNNNIYTYVYDLRDHVGNIRVRFSENSSTAGVEAFYDYYPYGDIIANRHSSGTNVSRQQYQALHSEKDEETGFNAFELRMYDAAIGRWMGPDKYRQFYNGYTGMGNNPVSGIDPNGGMRVKYNFDGTYSTTYDNWWHNTFVGVEYILQDVDGNYQYTKSKALYLEHQQMVEDRLLPWYAYDEVSVNPKYSNDSWGSAYNDGWEGSGGGGGPMSVGIGGSGTLGMEFAQMNIEGELTSFTENGGFSTMSGRVEAVQKQSFASITDPLGVANNVQLYFLMDFQSKGLGIDRAPGEWGDTANEFVVTATVSNVFLEWNNDTKQFKIGYGAVPFAFDIGWQDNYTALEGYKFLK